MHRRAVAGSYLSACVALVRSSTACAWPVCVPARGSLESWRGRGGSDAGGRWIAASREWRRQRDARVGYVDDCVGGRRAKSRCSCSLTLWAEIGISIRYDTSYGYLRRGPSAEGQMRSGDLRRSALSVIHPRCAPCSPCSAQATCPLPPSRTGAAVPCSVYPSPTLLLFLPRWPRLSNVGDTPRGFSNGDSDCTRFRIDVDARTSDSAMGSEWVGSGDGAALAPGDGAREAVKRWCGVVVVALVAWDTGAGTQVQRSTPSWHNRASDSLHLVLVT